MKFYSIPGWLVIWILGPERLGAALPHHPGVDEEPRGLDKIPSSPDFPQVQSPLNQYMLDEYMDVGAYQCDFKRHSREMIRTLYLGKTGFNS